LRLFIKKSIWLLNEKAQQGVYMSVEANVRYWLRRKIFGQPYFYYMYYKTRPKFSHRLVEQRTELVIEGFPRSANSYALHLFKSVNPSTVVAHHMHSQAQILRAVALGVPCLVLIRKPREAVLSLLLRERDENPNQVVSRYIEFYESVAKVVDSVVLAEFTEVVNDFGAIVCDLNLKFGREFQIPLQNSEVNSRVFDVLSKINSDREGKDPLTIAVPSSEKEAKKSEIVFSTRTEMLFKKASAIYLDLLRNSRRVSS
jgi:hypothetical protein